MTPTEFESRLRELLREQATVTQNAQCIECHGCEKCVLCTFCRDSRGSRAMPVLHRLHRLHRLLPLPNRARAAWAVATASPAKGAPRALTWFAASGSRPATYCFGSVGLPHKDFHILNEPYIGPTTSRSPQAYPSSETVVRAVVQRVLAARVEVRGRRDRRRSNRARWSLVASAKGDGDAGDRLPGRQDSRFAHLRG